MNEKIWWVILAASVLVGCRDQAGPAPEAMTDPAPTLVITEPATSAATGKSDEEIAREQIAKLPPDEQAIARAQEVCPISGEPLGSMGVPFKVKAGEKVAFLCCKGCKEDFDKDPRAALEKLSARGEPKK